MQKLHHNKFVGKLRIHDGYCWGLLDKNGEIETWAPVCKLNTETASKALHNVYKLLYFYYEAGIADTITGPIVIHDNEKVIKVIKGTARIVDVPSIPFVFKISDEILHS